MSTPLAGSTSSFVIINVSLLLTELAEIFYKFGTAYCAIIPKSIMHILQRAYKTHSTYESRNVHPFYMFTPNFSKEDVSHPGCFTPGKFTPQIFHTPDYSPLRMFHPPWRIFHPACIIIYSPHRSFTPNSPCSPPIGGEHVRGGNFRH